MAALVVCGVLLTRRKPVTPTTYADADRRTGTVVGVAALVFALVYAGLAGSAPATAAYAPPTQLTAQIGGEFVDAEGTPQIELIGLRLSQTETIRAGDWLYIDLYWRALQPLASGWRVALTLIDPTLSIVWAQSDTGAPGGFDTATWPTDRYVVDRHILRVRADGEPYVADLAVRVYNDAGDLVYTGDPLPSIRIINPVCPPPAESMTPVSVQFGDRLILRAYDWQQDGDMAQLMLDWTTGSATGDDLALFVHFMRGDELVATADRPPLAAYPAHLWLPGQCLTHASVVDVPPEADRVL
ncbi:MAG: hypothetical protein KC547_19680, partial [Anaerolineae bacterium]|nr:hypothetical protein [Anaerolineae bacterium]